MKKNCTLILLLAVSFTGLSLSSFAQFPVRGTKVGGVKVNDQAVKAGTKVVKAVTLSDQDVIDRTIEYVDWMDKHNPVAKKGDKYAKRLENLVKGFDNYDGLDLNFKVYLVKDVNAFACADGSVRVCAGLMNLMTDDEIFGVIGHEIGHVKNHDTKDAMKTALLTSALKDAAASQSGVAAALSDTQLGDLAEAIPNAQFSQKQESKADDYGFNFLKDNDHDVYAMGSAFRKLLKLQEAAKNDKKKKQLLSSHPDTEKRAERMEKKADKASR